MHAIPNIQRVLRRAIGVQLQAIGLDASAIKHGQNLFATIQIIPVRAPGADHDASILGSFDNRHVVAGADRVFLGIERLRIGRPERKDVCHAHPTVPHAEGTALASFHGRIILGLVGGARIQHDKEGRGARLIPEAPKLEAVALAVRETGARKFSE